jgi:hypothetical protein
VRLPLFFLLSSQEKPREKKLVHLAGYFGNEPSDAGQKGVADNPG